MASPRTCRPPSTSFLPRTQTQSTLAPLAKIQASRIASPFLPASEGCDGVERHEVGRRACRQPASARAKRDAAAGNRRVEQRPPVRLARLGQHVARLAMEPLRIFELAQFVRHADQHVGIRAYAEAPAFRGEPPPGKSAVAEIGLGDRAEAGNCACLRHLLGLGLGHVGGVDQAPALRRHRHCASSHSTGRAPDHSMQSSTSRICSAAWMWIGPSGSHRRHRRQFLGRHGAQAVRRDADHRFRYRFNCLAA